MFNRKNQQPTNPAPLIPTPLKNTPLNTPEESNASFTNEHSAEQTIPSEATEDTHQRPDGFFMPLPAQLDSETEHSETTMIRNVLSDPDSETTLRPTPKGSPLFTASSFSPNRERSQEPKPLPEITENNALPQSLFPQPQQEKEPDESEEDPTAIFTNKT